MPENILDNALLEIDEVIALMEATIPANPA
jgi:hypothetical protein